MVKDVNNKKKIINSLNKKYLQVSIKSKLPYFKTYSNQIETLNDDNFYETAINAEDFNLDLIVSLLYEPSNNVFPIHISRICYYLIQINFFNKEEKELLLNEVKILIETSKQKRVKAYIAIIYNEILSINTEYLKRILIDAIEDEKSDFWEFELIYFLLKIEGSFDLSGGNLLYAYEKKFGLTEQQKSHIDFLKHSFTLNREQQKTNEYLDETLTKIKKEPARAFNKELIEIIREKDKQIEKKDKQIEILISSSGTHTNFYSNSSFFDYSEFKKQNKNLTFIVIIEFIAFCLGIIGNLISTIFTNKTINWTIFGILTSIACILLTILIVIKKINKI